jgi:hypothetical protein
MFNTLTMLAVFLTDAQQSITVGKLPPVTIARDCFDKWTLIFTGLLAVVGLLGVILACKTVLATRDNAKAALLNAQAIINAERAWVIMVIEQDKEFPRLFRLKAENRGRTPAMIVAASHECVVVQTEAEMPRLPEYRHGKRFPEGVFLFPGESQLITEFSRDHLRMPPVGEDRNGENDFQMVKDHKCLAIVFGNVVYRDILGPPEDLEHETRWCSLLKLGDTADELFLTKGRDGYTKHT